MEEVCVSRYENGVEEVLTDCSYDGKEFDELYVK